MPAKFYGNRPRGVRPTNSRNITSCDFVYLPFPSRSFPFYPRDAMLARVIEIATCLSVCPSVRPSVRLSRAGIVSKRRKLAS